MQFHDLTARNIYIIGDTHTPDINDLLIHYNFQDFIIIHVGDFGVGFYHPAKERQFLQEIQTFLEEQNGKLLVIRGNHDSPEYFNKHHWANQYENIELIEDFSYKTINNKKFLFAGGATSIDRQARTLYRDYWDLEKFVLPKDFETLDECDCLITHTSAIDEFPNVGFANIAGWFKNDPTLKEELIAEREEMQKLYNQVKPKLHLNGHFHESHTEYINDCLHKTLNINELYSLNL